MSVTIRSVEPYLQSTGDGHTQQELGSDKKPAKSVRKEKPESDDDVHASISVEPGPIGQTLDVRV